jgi:hypothetical protein
MRMPRVLEGMRNFIVTLTSDERRSLRKLISAGKAPARELQHARILPKTDRGPNGPGVGDAAVAEAVETSAHTVAPVRQRCCEEGQTAALKRRSPRRVYRRKLSGVEEAQLVAIRGHPPPGPLPSVRSRRRAGSR